MATVADRPRLRSGTGYANRPLLYRGFPRSKCGDIQGRVLEAGNNRYTLRFGGARVERSDILSVETSNPRATIVGDIARAGTP